MKAALKNLITGKGMGRVEDRFQFFIGISDAIISIGLFSLIFGIKLDIVSYFGSLDVWNIFASAFYPGFWERLEAFLNDQGVFALLALFTFIWYFRYKRAVKNEMTIIVNLYSKFIPPPNWENVVGRGWVPVLSVGLTLTFLVMAWFIDRIEAYCVVVIFLNILDVRGNTIIRRNLRSHFANRKFAPARTDPIRKFILQRRKIAEQYWLINPQIERIGLVMIGVMMAFLTALSENIFNINVPLWVPYLIIIATIFANEATMVRWRWTRNRALDDIDREEELSLQKKPARKKANTSK